MLFGIIITFVFIAVIVSLWLSRDYWRARCEEQVYNYNILAEKYNKLLADTPTRDKNGKFKPRNKQ